MPVATQVTAKAIHTEGEDLEKATDEIDAGRPAFLHGGRGHGCALGESGRRKAAEAACQNRCGKARDDPVHAVPRLTTMPRSHWRCRLNGR
jgi:hypothetical protein